MELGAVIIAFKADQERLRRQINVLIQHLQNIVVVVNESINSNYNFNSKVTVHWMGSNKGIAEASNIGVEILKGLGSEWIMFCDQDTIFPTELFEKFKDLNKNRKYLYAPLYNNEISDYVESKFIGKVDNRIKYVNKNSNYIYQVIASGMIVNIKEFNNLNGFREDLFIDWVDLEFCWRFVRNGGSISILPVTINHRLGDSGIKIFNKHIPIRGHIRYYYLIRNGIYLAIYYPFESWRIRIFFLQKVISEFIGYTILSITQPKKISFLTLGLYHGMIKKLGKL